MPLKSIPRLPCLALPLTFLALLPMTDSPGFWQFLHCSSIDEDRKIRDEYSNENQLQPSSPSVRLLGCLDICALVFLNAYHVLGCVCVPVFACSCLFWCRQCAWQCLCLSVCLFVCIYVLRVSVWHIETYKETDRERRRGRETENI